MIAADESLSKIQQFYKGQNIFITGSTGFLGRILLEKLLRSCKDIGTIYLLIRPKKGKSGGERMDDLFGDVVFERLRKDFPEFVKKIVRVDGDVTSKDLGMSAADRTRISNEVSIIFHVAATIRFNEKLNTAVKTNVNSIKEVIELGRDCKNLRVAVHVSTAYSNCVRETIGEKLYAPPLSFTEINEIIRIAEKHDWSEEMLQGVTEKLIGKWPNTYTFTKAIAEGVVAEYAEDLPFGVFRPSIVTGCWGEPVPGWTKDLIGFNGVIAGLETGVMNVLNVAGDVTVDIIPADTTCNALIVCAWEIAETRKRYHDDTSVYNYVSGTDNPITCYQIYQICSQHAPRVGTNKAVWDHRTIITRSRALFRFLDIFLHMIPALLIDNIGRIFGNEPKYYPLYCKVFKLADAMSFFCMQQWHFENDKIRDLWTRLDSRDKIIFPFDVRSIVWKDYMFDMLLGVRRYILRDPDETLSQGRRKIKIFYILNNLVCLLFAAFICWIIWKIYLLIFKI